MFERFTSEARQVVVLSQEAARELNHNYIGTEHILLGLLGEGEGIAARVLGSLGVTLELAKAEIEEILGRSTQVPAGALPFTPRAKKVLELSLREALQLGHRHIGTEHILLGLIREGQGVAVQVMTKLGADPSRTRAGVIHLLEGLPAEPRPAREQPAGTVLQSLQAENLRLRAEVDRLRDLLLELGADEDDVVPPGPEEPAAGASGQAPGEPAGED